MRTFNLRNQAPVASMSGIQQDTGILVKALGTWERRGFVATLIILASVINGLRAPVQSATPGASTSAFSAPAQTDNGAQGGQQRQQELQTEKQVAEAKAAADKAALARLAAEEQARQEAEQEAATKHAAELARYLDVKLSKSPGKSSVAVAVATEDSKLDRNVGQALARRFKTNDVELLPSLFAPEFVSDGLFDKTFDGSRDSLATLDLANTLNGIVLAKESVEYTQDASLDNVTSAHLRLQVTAMPVSSRGDSQTWTFTANGAGFKRDVAREMAVERLIKQIDDDTNMALRISPNQ